MKNFENTDCNRFLTVVVWSNAQKTVYRERAVTGKAKGVVIGENGSRKVIIKGCTLLEGIDDRGKGICRERGSKTLPGCCLYEVNIQKIERRGRPKKKGK